MHQFLTDHAHEQPGGYGPAAIGKHLGRSQGAVANSLDKLVNQGLVIQVNDKPRRFAPVQDPAAPPTTPDPTLPEPARPSPATGQASPPPAAANGHAASAAPEQPAKPPEATHTAANGTNPTAAA